MKRPGNKLQKTLIVSLICSVCCSCFFSQTRAKPPSQPSSGPGSTAYAHTGLHKKEEGSGAYKYWLFTPAEPVPDQAPVILFLHGWRAVDPRMYGAWIEHLVKRGNTVLFPRYQISGRDTGGTGTISGNSIHSLKSALQLLREAGPGPDMKRFAVIGHSAGGLAAANTAAALPSHGLPFPRALMCVQPGLEYTRSGRLLSPIQDLTNIPATCLLLVVTGDIDETVGNTDAKKIFSRTAGIPEQNKDILMLVSDNHGDPVLAADHSAPFAVTKIFDVSGPAEQANEEGCGEDDERTAGPGKTFTFHPPNQIDFALWRLFDALTDAAFYGKNREYALGGTDLQRTMGTWSDGTPVKKLEGCGDE